MPDALLLMHQPVTRRAFVLKAPILIARHVLLLINKHPWQYTMSDDRSAVQVLQKLGLLEECLPYAELGNGFCLATPSFTPICDLKDAPVSVTPLQTPLHAPLHTPLHGPLHTRLHTQHRSCPHGSGMVQAESKLICRAQQSSASLMKVTVLIH